jgi:NAD(P)-dependent dehydrogenase (short-subunit alcohol dehydrogenase family)
MTSSARGNQGTGLGHERESITFTTQEIPEQRMGDEDDIAGAILFLASRAGAYCNGNVLVTDGGRLSVNPATY